MPRGETAVIKRVINSSQVADSQLFFFSSRGRHTRLQGDWSSDVCSSDLARCSDRLEALIFGMGDYSGSQGIDTREIGGTGGYPGDIFHYARFRVTAAARAAGIDAVDGPFANFKNEEGYRAEAQKARALGMVGKWAIH